MKPYVLIPSGVTVWSIDLQERIKFEKDVIVEITGTSSFSKNQCFGNLMMLLFNVPGQIPTLISKAHGDISFDLSQSEPYEIPKPQFYTFKKE